MDKKTKLVLLIGSGRSGSTLIDRIVNMDKNIFGTGEISNFGTATFEEYCSCGKIVKSCPCWSSIISKIGWEEKDYQQFKRYQMMFEYPMRGRIFKTKDYSDQANFDEYISKNDEILTAISLMNENKIIFDSSKSPQRALNLTKSNALDIKIIYLMRDPRGVVWSYKKSFRKDLKAGLQKDMKGRSILKSIYSWIAINSRSFSAIKSANVPTLFVSYKDFCRSPEDQIRRILNFSLEETSKDNFDFNPPSNDSSHTISGNRLRMQKEIKIMPDFNWKKNLNFFQKTFVLSLTFPLIYKFKRFLRE